MINFGFDDIETMESKDKSICFYLNNDLYHYKKDIVQNYIEKNESFIYPLLIWNNDLFLDVMDITIPQNVKTQVDLGKCKIVLFYVTEPWFMYEYCYKWLSNFSTKNGLNKDNFIFVSSNLKSPEIKDEYVQKGIIDDNYTIIEFNHHFHRLWFYTHNFHMDFSHELYEKTLNENLKKQKDTKKEQHFLCFNRRPHDHRVAIFAEIMTNPKLKEKTLLTLGNEGQIIGQSFKDAIRRFIDESYKYGHHRLYNFIDGYNGNFIHSYDTDSMSDQNYININLEAHNKTFCNIVTETLTSEDVLFFTEKTLKSIFALQPFIIIGNRGSLKKLKEYGFKTFDKWWDESYDDLKYQSRFEKIVEIINEIATWDESRINQTLMEMEETLIHNFRMLVEDNSTKDFFNKFLKII